MDAISEKSSHPVYRFWCVVISSNKIGVPALLKDDNTAFFVV